MNIHAIEEIKDTATGSRPVLAIRLGRGRTGGTTVLDFLVQRARSRGTTIKIADGDRRNATLSELYPIGQPGGALRPEGTEIGDVAEWVTEVVSQMAEEQVSMVLDMGAGDEVLEAHAKQMNLGGVLRGVGDCPLLAIYTLGPRPADLHHALGIYEKGYVRVERTLFVANRKPCRERQGRGRRVRLLMEDPRYRAIEDDIRSIRMPKLACMETMRDERLSLYEAVEGERGASGRPMSLGHQFIIRTWIQPDGATARSGRGLVAVTAADVGAGSPRETSRGGRGHGRGAARGRVRVLRIACGLRSVAAGVRRGSWGDPHLRPRAFSSKSRREGEAERRRRRTADRGEFERAGDGASRHRERGRGERARATDDRRIGCRHSAPHVGRAREGVPELADPRTEISASRVRMEVGHTGGDWRDRALHRRLCDLAILEPATDGVASGDVQRGRPVLV